MVTFNTSTQLPQTLLADVLTCCQNISGDTSYTVEAPAGIYINPDTGLVSPPLVITPGGKATLRSTSVMNGTVVAAGVIPVNIYTQDNFTPIFCGLEIPWQLAIQCPCAHTDSDVFINNFEITTLSVSAFIGPQGDVRLSIFVTFTCCVKTTEKQTVNVESANVGCN